MNQNPESPYDQIEPETIVSGEKFLPKNLSVKAKTNNASKKTFSDAPFDLAKEFSRISSGYSKSESKEAISIIASLYGLRVVPMGIALKTSEPAKAGPLKKERKVQKDSSTGLSVTQACNSDPQFVALVQERQDLVFSIKQAEVNSEEQKTLLTSLRELELKLKTRKTELKEEISSKKVSRAT
jgi:hypothetical protein